MNPTVLWYLHDHGRGHLERARAVIPHVGAPVVVAAGPGISDVAERVLAVPVVALPSDVPDRPQPTTGPWHHAPAAPATTARALALARVVEEHHCTTAVVDVSVEVTVMARLLGMRTITLRQSGCRDDAAHRIGLDTADVVWVPQHPDLEPIGHPADDRWVFTGPFSRHDGAGDADRGGRGGREPGCGERLVTMMVGGGGSALDLAPWRDARPPPGWRVVIAGTGERSSSPGVDIVGFREPILPLLAASDVVVTSGGWAAVADTAAAGARLVVVPERRPFGEQVVRARALAAAGLAVALERWPRPDQLGDVLHAACSLRSRRWATYHDGHGAQRAAAMVDEVHTR